MEKLDLFSIRLQAMMALQEDYFETLVELGIHYENTGQLRQAFDLYQKGIEKAEKAKKMLEGTLVGMLD